MGGAQQQGGQGTPGPSSGWGGANPGFNPTGGIWDFNPQTIAGLSPSEQMGIAGAMNLGGAGANQYGAAQQGLQGLMGGALPWQMNAMTAGAANLGQLPGQANEAMNLYRQMRGVGSRQVGQNIESDPTYQAALNAVQNTIIPGIGSQAALSGLGRSQPMLDAQATAASQYMLPVIEGVMGRQERGLDRELGAMGAGAGGLLSGAGMQQQGNIAGLGMLGQAGSMANQNQQFGTQGMMQLGDTAQRNALSQIQALMGTGALPRELDQQQNDAMYQEWMRLMGTGENAMGAPLGFLPNLLGGSSTSQKK